MRSGEGARAEGDLRVNDVWVCLKGLAGAVNRESI
jgi:hypothetical protein